MYQKQTKKQQKQQEQLIKKLSKFSKNDYDVINWALFYTLTEVEKKRHVTDEERDQILRLMTQTAAIGDHYETVNHELNQLKKHRNNYNLTLEQLAKEVNS